MRLATRSVRKYIARLLTLVPHVANCRAAIYDRALHVPRQIEDRRRAPAAAASAVLIQDDNRIHQRSPG